VLASAHAAHLVVFGDSWGTEGAKSLRQVFGAKGITIDNVAKSGSTAEQWARTPNAVRDAVRKNPDAKWVWLTVGGNDAKNELSIGVPVEKLIQEMINRTRIILKPLFDDNPTIRVVQFGYDVLTFSKGLLCPAFGALVFPKCKGNITCVNTEFLLMQYAYVEKMRAAGPFPRHDSVNLLGTLQVAGKVPGAQITKPNLAYYSPDQYMQANCIHANDEGYVIIFQEFWNRYFSKF